MLKFIPATRLTGALALLLVASAPTLAPHAYAEAGVIGVDDVSFAFGPSIYKIKHLEVSGTTLSAAEVKALFASIGSASAAAQLPKLDAKTITIPEMTLEQTIAVGKTTAVYHDVVLTDVHGGVIGSYVIASGEVGGTMSTGDALTGNFTHIMGTDIDLPGLAHVFTASSPDGTEPLKPLYGTSTIDGYTVKTPMFELSIGKSALNDIRGRPMLVPLSQILTNMPAPPKPGEPQTPEQTKAYLAALAPIFDLYSAFSLGAMDIHDFKMTTTGNPALAQPPLTIKLARFLTSDYGPKGIGEIRLEGIDVEAPNGKFHLGKYAIHDIGGKPMSQLFSTIVKTMPTPPQPGKPASPEDQKAAMAMLSALLDVYGSMSIGKMEIEDTKFATSNDPSTHQPVSMSLGRIALTDFANARIGEFRIEGITIAPPKGSIHLGKMSLKGFDFHDWLASLGTAMALAAADPNAGPAAFTGLKQVKLDDLSLAGLAVDLAVPAPPGDPTASTTPVQFALDAADVKETTGTSGLVSAVTSTIDHFVMKLPPTTPDLDVMAAAGFDKLDVSSKFDAHWNEQRQRLTLDDITMTDPVLGKVTMAATADNVPPEAFMGDKFMMQAAWLGALIKSADIQIDNRKAFDLILATQAKRAGTNADAARTTLITAAAAGIPAILGNSPAARQLGDTVAKFLANPKSLHVTIDSQDGIGAGDAAAPDHILDKVQLKAVANQ